MLTLIAAVAENNALGKDGDLPWRLPDDFKRFKKLTEGHHVILGRKTFESLPNKLPNRKQVILTRKKDYNPEDCVVVHNIKDAISFVSDDEQPFVIGGAEIYKLALPFIEKLELTQVHHSVDADTYFPEIDFTKWNLTEKDYHEKDEKHNYAFSFLTYKYKKKGA